MPIKDPIKRAEYAARKGREWYLAHKELTQNRTEAWKRAHPDKVAEQHKRARQKLMETTKICSTCGRRLSFDNFYSYKRKGGSYSGACCSCTSARYYKRRGALPKSSPLQVVANSPVVARKLPPACWDTYDAACKSICNGYALPEYKKDWFFHTLQKRISKQLEDAIPKEKLEEAEAVIEKCVAISDPLLPSIDQIPDLGLPEPSMAL